MRGLIDPPRATPIADPPLPTATTLALPESPDSRSVPSTRELSAARLVVSCTPEKDPHAPRPSRNICSPHHRREFPADTVVCLSPRPTDLLSRSPTRRRSLRWMRREDESCPPSMRPAPQLPGPLSPGPPSPSQATPHPRRGDRRLCLRTAPGARPRGGGSPQQASRACPSGPAATRDRDADPRRGVRRDRLSHPRPIHPRQADSRAADRRATGRLTHGRRHPADAAAPGRRGRVASRCPRRVRSRRVRSRLRRVRASVRACPRDPRP